MNGKAKHAIGPLEIVQVCSSARHCKVFPRVCLGPGFRAGKGGEELGGSTSSTILILRTKTPTCEGKQRSLEVS